MNLRKCRSCGEEKPQDSFAPHRSICRGCTNRYQRDQRARNLSDRRRKEKEYRDKNKRSERARKSKAAGYTIFPRTTGISARIALQSKGFSFNYACKLAGSGQYQQKKRRDNMPKALSDEELFKFLVTKITEKPRRFLEWCVIYADIALSTVNRKLIPHKYYDKTYEEQHYKSQTFCLELARQISRHNRVSRQA